MTAMFYQGRIGVGADLVGFIASDFFGKVSSRRRNLEGFTDEPYART